MMANTSQHHSAGDVLKYSPVLMTQTVAMA
jgi:hypothetical protein